MFSNSNSNPNLVFNQDCKNEKILNSPPLTGTTISPKNFCSDVKQLNKNVNSVWLNKHYLNSGNNASVFNYEDKVLRLTYV